MKGLIAIESYNKPLSVYGYARVSTENQLENYSIDEQVDRIKAYCTARGWLLQNIYIDAGYSGGNTNRPDLQRLLKDIKTHAPNIVLVYKLDRLSRSQKDTMMLIEDTFLAQNIDFVSINENFDTSTPFGRAMVGILAVFAQLEKDQITERFTMGRIGRSKAGYYQGGATTPIGYKYIDGELIVDEYAALQVQEVYQLFLAGKSINGIYRIMSQKYGGQWNNAATVRNVLLNNVYIGKVKFKKTAYPGRHQPIISQEDFDCVQTFLRSMDRESRKNSAQKTPFRANHLLSSLIKCQRCGARYGASHGYYKCYSRSKDSQKYVIDPNCKNAHWKIEVLDQVVTEQIYALINNCDQLASMYTTNKEQKRRQPNYNAIKQRIKELDKQISRMLDLYQIGNLPLEQISQRLDEMNVEKNRLTDELNFSHEHETKFDKKWKLFVDALQQFKNTFNTLDLDNRRILISTIVESILIDGQHVTVQWRI